MALCAGCDYRPAPPVAAEPAISQPAPKPVTGSEWEVARTVNDLDKSSQTTLAYGGMVLRCAPKDEGYVSPVLRNLGGQLDSDNEYEQTVRYRLDDGPIRSGRWRISSSFDALFIPRPVLREMGKAKTLTIEYKPQYIVPQTQAFDVSGLGAAEALAGCKL